MPKAASPIRLQAELMRTATIAGQRQHRSTAEQIKYWAAIGRSLAKIIDQDTLLELSAGLAVGGRQWRRKEYLLSYPSGLARDKGIT